jgi:hexosaminidase
MSLPSAPTIRVSDPREGEAARARLERVLSAQGLLPATVTRFENGAAAADFDLQIEAGAAELRPEGYRLSIKDGRVSLLARDAAGLFRGVCTIEQLVSLSAGSLDLPELVLEDWPDFPHRGVMLDVSRDKVPTMTTLYELVDLLARFKVNQLQLYMEHTFAYAGHEIVWREASPFSTREIAELDAFCAARHIELVPNQNSFGHMQRWLKHEPYKRLAECPDGFEHAWNPTREPYGLCATDPASLALIQDLYDQLLPNFQSRQFNVGLDETIDLGLGRSKAACEERGTERVYLEFLQRIHALVSERGRTMQFWGDIILKRPELIRELPHDAIALEWGYEADHPFADHLRKFAEAGLEFYVCPGTSSWNTIGGRTENAIGNLASAAKNGAASGAIGILTTDWGDNGHLQPLSVSYLGLLLGAGFSWNAKDADRANELDVPALLDAHVFLDARSKLGQIAYDLGNAYRETGARPHNGSLLFQLLVKSDLPVTEPGVSRSTLEHTLGYLEEVRTRLSAVNNGSLVVEELGWATDMLLFACRLGLARFENGGDRPLASVAAEERRALARELTPLIERHRALWLSRNRAGGLADSVARLERTLATLES